MAVTWMAFAAATMVLPDWVLAVEDGSECEQFAWTLRYKERDEERCLTSSESASMHFEVCNATSTSQLWYVEDGKILSSSGLCLSRVGKSKDKEGYFDLLPCDPGVTAVKFFFWTDQTNISLDSLCVNLHFSSLYMRYTGFTSGCLKGSQYPKLIQTNVTCLKHNLDKAVTDLRLRVDELDASSNSMATHLSTMKKEISSLRSEVDGKISNVESMATDLPTMKKEISSLRSEVDGKINNSMATHLSITMKEDISILYSAVTDLAAKIDAKISNVEFMATHLSTMKEISSLRSEVDGKISNVESMATDLSTMKKEISSLRSEVDGKISNVESMAKDLSTMKKEISSLRSEVDGKISNVESMATHLSTMKEEISSLRSEVDGKINNSMATHLSTMKKDISSLRSAVTHLSAEMDEKISNVESMATDLPASEENVSSLISFDVLLFGLMLLILVGLCHCSCVSNGNAAAEVLQKQLTELIHETRSFEVKMGQAVADQLAVLKQHMDQLHASQLSILEQKISNLSSQIDERGVQLTELIHETRTSESHQPKFEIKVGQGGADQFKQHVDQLTVSIMNRLSTMEQKISTLSSQMDSHGASDTSSSAGSAGSWMHIASGQPFCFMPDTYFKVVTADGEMLLPARMLFQGAQVVAANGKVVEVVQPPEQHQVEAVIELQAGQSFLVVSPDHRILVPGNKTVQARELEVRSDVILDGTQATLTSFDWKLVPTVVLKISFRPDLPVAAFMRPPSILSKGSRRRPFRRGKKRAEDALTIPDTEGYLTD